MTIWIILGSLIGIVAIFLVITSVKDRKRAKIIKEKRDAFAEQASAARGSIAIFVLAIYKSNENALEKFQPSIGEYKMGDINNWSKLAYTKLKETKAYALVSQEDENKDMITKLDELFKLSVNTWSKSKNENLINFFRKEADVKGEEYTKFAKRAKVILKGIYNVVQ